MKKRIDNINGKIFYQGQGILNDYFRNHTILTHPITMANYYWWDKLVGFEEKPPNTIEGIEIVNEPYEKRSKLQKGIKAYDRNSHRTMSYNKM